MWLFYENVSFSSWSGNLPRKKYVFIDSLIVDNTIAVTQFCVNLYKKSKNTFDLKLNGMENHITYNNLHILWSWISFDLLKV